MIKEELVLLMHGMLSIAVHGRLLRAALFGAASLLQTYFASLLCLHTAAVVAWQGWLVCA